MSGLVLLSKNTGHGRAQWTQPQLLQAKRVLGSLRADICVNGDTQELKASKWPPRM